MPDMLVSLLNIPDDREDVERLEQEGINIRRVQPFEITILRRFVQNEFSILWADEVMNAFCHHPPTCIIATHEKKIVGFGAYECTRRDFFGPTGVKKEYRGRGIGKAIFLACLRGLYEMGYAYAIIGGAGPTDFYTRCAGAVVIPGSVPGVYVDMLEPVE